MTFLKGYNFTKVKTSHGPDMYVSRYGKLVRVVPCSPNVEVIRKIHQRLDPPDRVHGINDKKFFRLFLFDSDLFW